ncbi:putative lipoyltransferase 2, mitochondrial [Sitodiplosis mosellana]|uniref:putative lipoyltransferase 2, mitochondrial n=1 Tax=Sitodiplosis mosellana TaxID=263140 RepID=UPI0024438AEF|nr:putative lipoyltransferase 2, mitochondrial [Sitodiplosis mosellana]
MSLPLVHVLRTGLIKYAHGLNLQKFITSKFSEQNENKFRNILILTEHQPVYTIGIRTKNYSIDDESHLRSLGAEFYQTNRGGLITFHGPGQLVAYPIINLKDFQPSIRWYVCHLEKTIIDLCKQFNLNATTTSDTGVWIDDRKICAMGVHGKRYITSHGLALNCNIDLKWFDHIVPCGLTGKSVTSLTTELNRNVSISETTPLFLNSFKQTFNCQLIELPDDETKFYTDHMNLAA